MLVAFGIAGLASIGLFLLAGAAVVVALALATPALRPPAVPGFVVGLSTAPLYIAWLNRGGPGLVCTTTADSVSCADRGARGRSWRSGCCSPWAALSLLALTRRRRPGCLVRRSLPTRPSRRRARRLDDRDRLPRPRGDDPDAAGRARGPHGTVREGRQPVVAAHLGPRRPGGRRGGARADRRGAGGPSVRGGLHLRRHGGRQPRGQGRLARPTRAGPRPGRRRRERDRAPRGARPGRVPRAGPRGAGHLPRTRPLRPCRRRRPAGGAGARRCRRGERDVGEQRGGHGPAGRRARHRRPRARRARSTPTPCRPWPTSRCASTRAAPT